MKFRPGSNTTLFFGLIQNFKPDIFVFLVVEGAKIYSFKKNVRGAKITLALPGLELKSILNLGLKKH